MNERAVTICRGCVDLAGMLMTNDDPFIVIAGCRVVIAPPATKNFNSQNVRCWLDAIGVLSLDGEGEFSVFSFQGDGEDDPVEHDPPVCHATDRRAADCDRHALCIVPSHITQGDAVCGG